MKRPLFPLFLLFLGFSAFTQTAIMPSGTGTQNDPYVISTLENLYWISKETSSGNSFENIFFIQSADINAAPTKAENDFYSIGRLGSSTASPFSGYFNGNGYIIDSLYINKINDNAVGLFGYVHKGCVENLGLTNAYISGNSNVGGIVGMLLLGTVSKCYSSGKIQGQDSGGLVGYNSGGHIEDSYSLCDIEGNQRIGGFVGINGGNIINCYSYGRVSGNDGVGGFIGHDYPEGGSTECFWDKDTSGQNISSGGIGKTTNEMKDFSTYLTAIWDLKGVGNKEIWNLGNNRNNGYPYLSWQFPYDPPHPKAETRFQPKVRSLNRVNMTNGNYMFFAYIENPGNPFAVQHGFCWNTTGMPNIDDSKTEEGLVYNSGEYSSTIMILSAGTTYYVRPYATNSQGTVYGEQIIYITPGIPSIHPVGRGLGRDPYLISTLENLVWIKDETSRGNSFLNKIFIQTNDIDASPTKDWFDGEGWLPINGFRGNYNGNGFVIDSISLLSD